MRTAENLRRIRQERGLSYAGLSRRLAEIGHPILDTGLLKIEKGDRRVDVDDLVALALALGVTPNRLMLPDAGEVSASADVLLSQGVEISAVRAWEWAQGERPPAMPSEESQAWFDEHDGSRRSGVTFALENRPHLTSIPARDAVMAATRPVLAEPRKLMVTVLSVLAEGMRNGYQFPDLAAYIRRTTEVLLTYPETMPAEEIRKAIEQIEQASAGEGGALWLSPTAGT